MTSAGGSSSAGCDPAGGLSGCDFAGGWDVAFAGVDRDPAGGLAGCDFAGGWDVTLAGFDPVSSCTVSGGPGDGAPVVLTLVGFDP